MYRSPTDVRETTRARRIALLHRRLAEGIDLLGHAKQARWRAPGRELRRLLDGVAATAAAAVERIAGRAAEVAGTALGTMWIAARRSTLAELPPETAPAADHAAALAAAVLAFATSLRLGVDEARALGDAATASLLAEVATGLGRLASDR